MKNSDFGGKPDKLHRKKKEKINDVPRGAAALVEYALNTSGVNIINQNQGVQTMAWKSIWTIFRDI